MIYLETAVNFFGIVSPSIIFIRRIARAIIYDVYFFVGEKMMLR